MLATAGGARAGAVLQDSPSRRDVQFLIRASAAAMGRTRKPSLAEAGGPLGGLDYRTKGSLRSTEARGRLIMGSLFGSSASQFRSSQRRTHPEMDS
jgi:hypothetical protein